jgi:hypothetical protein
VSSDASTASAVICGSCAAAEASTSASGAGAAGEASCDTCDSELGAVSQSGSKRRDPGEEVTPPSSVVDTTRPQTAGRAEAADSVGTAGATLVAALQDEGQTGPQCGITWRL